MADGVSSSNLNFHGSQGVVLEDPGTLKTDRSGLSSCVAVWKIRKNLWQQLPAIGTAHPIFTFITIDSLELAFQGAWAVETSTYAGVSATYADNTPTYELIVGLSEEPIDTHPKFATLIGGTPMAPLNGARFVLNNADGSKSYTWSGTDSPTAPTTNVGWKFDCFMLNTGATAGALNPFAGIEQYLEASQMTWRRTVNSRTSISNISKAGKIDTPVGPAPNIAPRTWLHMGVNQTQKGSAYQQTTEWRASGRRAHPIAIYGTGS